MMKLKNLLVMVFLILTIIPITISSILLYYSGYNLSKESYLKNLTESISVQADYISQTLENNMLSDAHFGRDALTLPKGADLSQYITDSELYSAFQSYLEKSEDKVTVALLLDGQNNPIYTIGEKSIIDTVMSQLPTPDSSDKQMIFEVELSKDNYSLAIVTPIFDKSKDHMGRFISIYDPSYIFKIISSYYEIADSATYLCRENGDIINYRGATSQMDNSAVKQAFDKISFSSEGAIHTKVGMIPVSAYYKNISNSSWYLVGFIDNSLIYSFINEYVYVYILIIALVLVLDIMLAFYFSNKVVLPINHLIRVIEEYQNNLATTDLETAPKSDYYETRYLRGSFFKLMNTILLVQHNFRGIYQLYQSSDMGDINIELDVKSQTARSNKEAFQQLMDQLVLPKEACVVERFTNCFCEEDQKKLMEYFVSMRDKHLSTTQEAEIYTPHLNQKWFHSLVVPMYNDNRLSSLFVQLRDITSFKKQELVSNEQARRDVLTGLYNRAGFIEHVENILQQTNEGTAYHGMLFIDMDYFKLVNDNFGHSEGDTLLCSVGKTLTELAGSNDIVSRFGGDEFALFLPHTTKTELEHTKDVLGKHLIFPYQTDTISFTVSASIGSSIWNHEDPTTLEKLLQQADASMYQAKREFKENSHPEDNES